MSDTPKYSVVMTLYNRPVTTLINTLSGLGKNDLKDTEILIVNDGSTTDYTSLVEGYQQAGCPVRMLTVDTVKDRPGTYNIDGHNNPAYAANEGIKAAKGEIIFWMSSDCWIQPPVTHLAKKFDLKKIVWMPRVVDMDTSQVYLGSEKITPFGWFVAAHRETYEAVPWDEEYLKGIAYEDNDWSARMALHTGRLVIDENVHVWHQSHPPVAYSDELKGCEINRRYTKEKWGGVPWDGRQDGPLTIHKTDVNHQVVLDVERKKVPVS